MSDANEIREAEIEEPTVENIIAKIDSIQMGYSFEDEKVDVVAMNINKGVLFYSLLHDPVVYEIYDAPDPVSSPEEIGDIVFSVGSAPIRRFTTIAMAVKYLLDCVDDDGKQVTPSEREGDAGAK